MFFSTDVWYNLFRFGSGEMSDKRYKIAYYVITYVILVLIFKGIHFILPISFDTLSAYPLVFIPICFLVINNLIIKDLEREELSKKDFVWPLCISFTIINLLFRMPLFYDLCTVLFIILLKGRRVVRKEETLKTIAEYYEKHNKK